MGLFSIKFKCRKCGKEFDEWKVKEWLNDEGEEDEDGGHPVCPYCGSDNVK